MLKFVRVIAFGWCLLGLTQGEFIPTINKNNKDSTSLSEIEVSDPEELINQTDGKKKGDGDLSLLVSVYSYPRSGFIHNLKR